MINPHFPSSNYSLLRTSIEGNNCNIATTTPGCTTIGSGTGGFKFNELTADRLPSPLFG